MLDMLRKQNQDIEILTVEHPLFKPYGRVHSHIQVPKMAEYVTGLPMPEDEIYIPLCTQLMKMREAEFFTKQAYAQVPCQIGYFLSHNTKLNALEYHKCSETLVVLEDEVALLGKIEEIEKDTYDVGKLKAFFFPRGSVIELYGTTLHFAPCMATSRGIRQIVVLSRDTNTPLAEKVESKEGENKLLLERNKWVIAHAEAGNLVGQGAHVGLNGKNIEIKPVLL